MDLIQTYLNKNYNVNDINFIIDLSLNEKITGIKLIKQISVIFGVEENESYEQIKKWIISKIPDELVKNYFAPSFGEWRRNNNFVLNLPKEFDIPPYLIKSVSQITRKFRHEFGLAFTEWDDIEISFYDVIEHNLPQKLFNLFDNYHSKALNFNLMHFSSNGETIDEVEILGYVKEISFDGMDYTSDGIPNIKMIIGVHEVLFL